MGLHINSYKRSHIAGGAGLVALVALAGVSVTQLAQSVQAVTMPTVPSSVMTPVAMAPGTDPKVAKAFATMQSEMAMLAKEAATTVMNDPELAAFVAIHPEVAPYVAQYKDAVTMTVAAAQKSMAMQAMQLSTKDQVVDLFNRTKAEIFNGLEVLKNEFAARLSNMGHEANVFKDHWVGRFNSFKDYIGNRLEQIKNTFADRAVNG